ELEIVRLKVPGATERLAREVVAFVQGLRGQGLFKNPGIAETLDWANARAALDQKALDPDMVPDTLGALLKHQDDIARVEALGTAGLVSDAKAAADRAT